MTLTDMINFAIDVSGITISVLGLVIALRVHNMDAQIRQYFLFIFSVMIIYTSSNLLSLISLEFLGPDFALLSKAAIFSESFFSSLLMPILTLLMLRLCAQPLNSRLFYAVLLLWFLYIVLLIITQFTTVIYYITSDNQYMRGPYYPVLLIPPVLLMICNMAGLYLRKSVLSPREYSAFRLYLLIPLAAMLLQMLRYGIYLVVLGASVSALILFVFILDDQSQKSISRALEIGEHQLRIRSLQMRPHFIYNTMSNIYYLCELDPKKAQSVIRDFTTYLRNNFSAVVKQGLIPFEQELMHTKAYLDVVSARYEELLSVKYDTPYTAFLIPPLTLEPIVENAVNHGLDPESAPLQILILTRQSEDGAEIIVENSGTELDLSRMENPEPSGSSEGESHIGLKNVSDRMKALCRGSVTLSAREGGGAVVRMFIPADV